MRARSHFGNRIGGTWYRRSSLRAKDQRRNIGRRIELMRDNLQGDVTKLKDQGNRYRLRIGSYRVMFALVGEAIQIYAVKDRKEAYE